MDKGFPEDLNLAVGLVSNPVKMFSRHYPPKLALIVAMVPSGRAGDILVSNSFFIAYLIVTMAVYTSTTCAACSIMCRVHSNMNREEVQSKQRCRVGTDQVSSM